MFDAIFTGIAWLLNFFYELLPNYAFAIAMLTLAVMLITTPITLKGTRSMLQLQALQPEMRRIQQKFKDDAQKRNEEMMRFYKENNVNPLGGCLPTLLQLPIFFILFQVLQGLTKTEADGTFAPKYLDHASELFRDLDGSREMLSFGVDLSESASEALGQGVGEAFPYLLLIALVAASSFYQQRQMQRRMPASAASNPAANIMKFMPLITVVISYTFPAALVIYFVTSNLYRIGQQAYITKTLYSHHDSPGKKAQRAAEKVQQEKEAEGDTGPTSFKRPVKSSTPKPKPASPGKPKPSAGSGQNRNRSGSGNPNGARRNGDAKRAPASHPRSKKKRKRR